MDGDATRIGCERARWGAVGVGEGGFLFRAGVFGGVYDDSSLSFYSFFYFAHYRRGTCGSQSCQAVPMEMLGRIAESAGRVCRFQVVVNRIDVGRADKPRACGSWMRIG